MFVYEYIYMPISPYLCECIEFACRCLCVCVICDINIHIYVHVCLCIYAHTQPKPGQTPLSKLQKRFKSHSRGFQLSLLLKERF